MHLTKRHVILGVQILTLVALVLMLINELILSTDQVLRVRFLTGIIVCGTVLLLYWRGWRFADQLLILLSALMSGLLPPIPNMNKETVLTVLVPPIYALIMERPVWIVISFTIAQVVLLVRAQDTWSDPGIPALALLFIVLGGLVLSALVTRTARRQAEENAHRADSERARAEQQAAALAEANHQMSEQIEQQRQLLSLVATLETPVATLAEGVLLAPIVGHLDPRRAEALTTRLLSVVHEQRARMIVLDIGGVSVVDTSVAGALLQTTQALRLLGCAVALSGISASVAATLVGQGVSLDGVMTVRGPQEALARYQAEQRDKAVQAHMHHRGTEAQR